MHHFVLAKLLKFQETFLDLLFLKEKVGKRTSHQMHYFVLVKLLRFQRTFLEKSFVSGFGADAPIYNAHKKHTAMPCVFHFLIKSRSYAVVVSVDLFLICCCSIFEEFVKLCGVLGNGVGSGYNICRISLEEMTPHKLITCVVTA